MSEGGREAGRKETTIHDSQNYLDYTPVQQF